MINVYADGSASPNPGRGGYAAIVSSPAGEVRLTGGFVHTTNNRMELLGVIVALESLDQRAVVTVVSDSQYVVKGRYWAEHSWQKNGWRTKGKTPVANQDLWARLLACCERHDVTFEWTKGHAGHRYNEECDVLAAAAAQCAMAEDLG